MVKVSDLPSRGGRWALQSVVTSNGRDVLDLSSTYLHNGIAASVTEVIIQFTGSLSFVMVV